MSHDQIGMDLARHAGDRAEKVMLDAFKLCDSPAQTSMVAIQVLGIVAANACGALTASYGLAIPHASTVEMLELLTELMREAETERLSSGDTHD